MARITGYKIYFKDNRFVYEDRPSVVEDVPADSTTAWYADKTSAKLATYEHNKYHVKDVKVCKSCGNTFLQSESEREWFTERNLKPPCRCYTCRKKVS